MILQFEDFLLEKQAKEDLSLYECYAGQNLLLNKAKDFGFLSNEINENLFQNIGKTLKSVKDKAVQKILQGISNLPGLVKAFVDTVISFFKSAWNMIKNSVDKSLKGFKDDLIKEVKNTAKDGKDKELGFEVSNLGKIGQYLVKFFTGGIKGEMQKAVKAVSDENLSENVTIFILDEMSKDKDSFLELIEEGAKDGPSIPFISKIAHKIAEFPPFSWLHKIVAVTAGFTNSAAEKLSALSSKLGGPGPYKFAIIGGFVGLAVEWMVKDFAKLGIKKLGKKMAKDAIGSIILHSLPGLKTSLKAIKYTAIVLWVVSVVEQTLKAI